MKTTKEMIDVMQAYERGEQIEAKLLNNDIYGWDETLERYSAKMINMLSYFEFFNKCKFEYGTPCGKEVDVCQH